MPNGNILVCAGFEERRRPGKLFEIKPIGKNGGEVVWECNVSEKLGDLVQGYIYSVSYNPSLDQVMVNIQALAPLLIKLTPHTAVPQTIALLDADIDQQDGLFYLYHLRHARDGWTPDLRRTFFRILGTYETFLGGRGLPLAFKNIRREALETLTAEEKKQYGGFISQKPLLPPMPDLTGRGQVRQWKVSDFEGKLGFDASERSLANGRRMFSIALCSR